MTGNDWSNCWGEVFQIYQYGGTGQVVVRDWVGLCYPAQPAASSHQWLSCYSILSSSCAKSTCPGSPSNSYELSSTSKWTSCWGAFIIYARRKSTYDVNDDIMLYYQAMEAKNGNFLCN